RQGRFGGPETQTQNLMHKPRGVKDGTRALCRVVTRSSVFPHSARGSSIGGQVPNALQLGVFRERISPLTPIDRGPAATAHTRMADHASGTELSDLHMIVLGRIAHRGIANIEDIACWLGVSVVVAEALCGDLARHGLAHGSAWALTTCG